VPAGTCTPPKVKSRLDCSVVAELAPVRQSSPYGTNAPKTGRPFTPGLE
jgi:hypothetical protein